MSSKVQTSAPPLGTDKVSSWGENPLFHVTRLCLSFLQNLFKQAPEGNFHWDADRQKTQIVITDELPLHSEVLNKRPAIITVRSPVAFAGIALEQMMSLNLKTGERVHSDLISGHMTFNCLSRVKVEAEQLGWLVARHLWILHRIFMRAGFHKMGERVQILAASPAGAIIVGDTEGEVHNVPVVSPYHFQWTERITPLNLWVLNEIEANMTVEMKTPEEHTTTVPLLGTAVNQEVKLTRGRIRPAYMRGRPITQDVSQDTETGDTPVPSTQPASDPIVIPVVVEK